MRQAAGAWRGRSKRHGWSLTWRLGGKQRAFQGGKGIGSVKLGGRILLRGQDKEWAEYRKTHGDRAVLKPRNIWPPKSPKLPCILLVLHIWPPLSPSRLLTPAIGQGNFGTPQT